MTEHDSNNEIEQILRRYRPAGPPMELKERILKLVKTKAISFSLPKKDKKSHWTRYAVIAAAASVLIAAGGYFLLDRLDRDTDIKPKEAQLSFAEIERQISQSGRAARLLATADMLAKHSSTEQIVREQYRYITETYPQTTAGIEAKSRIQSRHQ